VGRVGYIGRWGRFGVLLEEGLEIGVFMCLG
jgi:hypothetical protein